MNMAKRLKKVLSRLFIAALFLTTTEGCMVRRPPSSEPRMYKREEAALPKKPDETYLSDRYPWEGKTRTMDGLTGRIRAKETEIDSEIKRLDAFMKNRQKNP